MEVKSNKPVVLPGRSGFCFSAVFRRLVGVRLALHDVPCYARAKTLHPNHLPALGRWRGVFIFRYIIKLIAGPAPNQNWLQKD